MSEFIQFLNSELGVGITLFVLGVFSLIGAAFSYFRVQRFINSAHKTTGQITGLRSHRGSKGGTTYSPIYQFRTLDGQTIDGEENFSSNLFVPKVGQSVEVYYDPNDPKISRLNNKMSLYFTSGLSVILGGTFTLVGFGISVLYSFQFLLQKLFGG